jgi:Transcription factor WhiB
MHTATLSPNSRTPNNRTRNTSAPHARFTHLDQEAPMILTTDHLDFVQDGLHDPRPSIVTEPREPDSPPGSEEPTPSRAPVARCADGHGTMVGLFFSDNIIDIARAKAMCGLCPLRVSCLADALDREEPWGVWGGELLSGGRIIANKRACGRPPTRPRPEMIIDEMGPVGVVA